MGTGRSGLSKDYKKAYREYFGVTPTAKNPTPTPPTQKTDNIKYTTNNDIPMNQSWKSFTQASIQQASRAAEMVRRQISESQLLRDGLNNTAFQKMVLALKLDGPGTVLPNADYDRQFAENALNGVELYRGSTREAIDNLMFGKRGYMGDGIHGNGIYFSTSQYTAKLYGSSQVTAFIDKNLARVVNEDTIRNMFDRESYSIKESFGGTDYMSALSSYALYKGYNVIVAPGGNGRQSVRQYGTKYGVDYYIPLTREVLVIREHNRPYKASNWRMY